MPQIYHPDKMAPDDLPKHEAKCWDCGNHDDYGEFYTADQMRAYAAEQVAAERERCAKVCEAQIDGYGDLSIYTHDVPWEAETMGQIRMAKECAAAIRAGQTEA